MGKYYELYSTLEQFKQLNGSEYIALCIYHPDKKPSLSINVDKGVHYCFACQKRGNAYQLAQDIGHHNPKEFLTLNGTNNIEYNNTPEKPPKQKQQLDKLDTISTKKKKVKDIDKLEAWKNNLRDKWMDLEYRDVWDISVIDECDTGLDDNNQLVFAHHNKDGKIVNLKHHSSKDDGNKTWSDGDGSSMWYLRHKIASYSKEKDLYISEGHKDANVLKSKGIQVIAVTNGCGNFPKNDLEILKGWRNTIYIPFDNDNGGIDGAKKLAQELLRIDRNLDIVVSRWKDSLPKGFDVYDSFMKDGGKDFRNSLKQPSEKYKIGGFTLIRGTEADTIEVKDIVQIITALLPEKQNIIIGGAEGCNKSIFAMNMAMSLASNNATFLNFPINKKNLKILYVDTECGMDEMTRRYQKIQKGLLNWNTEASSRFNYMSKSGGLVRAFDDIDKACEILKPDVLFIDCLYNTTDGADISKNKGIQPVLEKIDYLKAKWKTSNILVHHFNKGGEEYGLTTKRLNGAGRLLNWMEHCILITKTNEHTTRLMKIAKTRAIEYPSSYFRLEVDYPIIINRGVCEDWKKLTIEESKKAKWNDVLTHMPLSFETADFMDKCTDIVSVSERTARNWLQDMVMHRVLVKLKQGHYRKEEGFLDTDDAF